MNKLGHKNMNVSCFQDIDILNAPVLSDIYGSGPREEAYILSFYDIAQVL